MSPKPDPKFAVPSRRSPSSQDKAFSELEKRAEERGNGIAGTVPPERPATAAVSSKLRRDERGVRVAGYLPPEMEAELRMFCARERRSISDALTEAVAALLKNHPEKDK